MIVYMHIMIRISLGGSLRDSTLFRRMRLMAAIAISNDPTIS